LLISNSTDMSLWQKFSKHCIVEVKKWREIFINVGVFCYISFLFSPDIFLAFINVLPYW